MVMSRAECTRGVTMDVFQDRDGMWRGSARFAIGERMYTARLLAPVKHRSVAFDLLDHMVRWAEHEGRNATKHALAVNGLSFEPFPSIPPECAAADWVHPG